jgi:hypothetical protein
LSETKILSFKKENGNIFLSYANKAINLAIGKNCMILPIPGKMKNEWFYDTTKYSQFMNHIADQTVVSESLAYGVRSRGMKSKAKYLSLSYTKVGMYDVHFSNSMSDLEPINQTLKLGISHSLMSFFVTHYAKFGFICCLFDSNKEMESQPIALEYEPSYPFEILFYPTMDSHTGFPPTKDEVSVDHLIIAPVKNKQVSFSTNSVVPDFLNFREWGTYQLSDKYENGDIYFDLTQNMTNPNLKRSYETII